MLSVLLRFFCFCGNMHPTTKPFGARKGGCYGGAKRQSDPILQASRINSKHLIRKISACSEVTL